MKNNIPDRLKVTEEMKINAAGTVLREMSEQVSAEVISQAYRRYMDGFDLAKAIEDSAGISLSKNDVDALDCMDREVSASLSKAEFRWESDFNIKPPLPVGAKIKEGVITVKSAYHAASYMVKGYGCTNDSRHRIIQYEKAEVLKDASQ